VGTVSDSGIPGSAVLTAGDSAAQLGREPGCAGAGARRFGAGEEGGPLRIRQDLLSYDPAAANEVFDTAGFAGPITITYNADGDQRTWIEAVCNSIRNTLDVECQAVPIPDTATFNENVEARKVTGLIRGASVMELSEYRERSRPAVHNQWLCQ
jgi:hypothetical protein